MSENTNSVNAIEAIESIEACGRTMIIVVGADGRSRVKMTPEEVRAYLITCGAKEAEYREKQAGYEVEFEIVTGSFYQNDPDLDPKYAKKWMCLVRCPVTDELVLRATSDLHTFRGVASVVKATKTGKGAKPLSKGQLEALAAKFGYDLTPKEEDKEEDKEEGDAGK